MADAAGLLEPFFRPQRLSLCFGGLAAGLLAATLAAAAAPPALAPADQSERQLFGEVYKDVLEYHITATSPDVLTLAGLGALVAIDPTLSITRHGDTLSLDRGNDPIETIQTPPVRDVAGWGRLTGRLAEAARAASPAVAAVPADQLDEKLIDAALGALDPFSRYVRPAVARQRRTARDGFEGVGVTIALRQGQVSITAVLPDTPAAAAGLAIDDNILAVDGDPAAQISLEALRQRLRGKAGQPIALIIARAGAASLLHVSLRPAHIVAPAVTLETRDGVAWLKVSSFNQGTAALTAELLREAHRRLGPALHGIVLDLRGDPGGLLDQAVDLASLFLDHGLIASTIGRLPESFQKFAAPAGGRPETLPLAVLVNGGSASASEVVASALQDKRRAVVIGTSSYGKGTVQTVIETANGGELTVTWAQLITPRGYHLNHHGVVPNICTIGAAESAMLAQPVPAAADQPRNLLDDAGWDRLRASCPAQWETRAVDFQVARRLLGDPALYSRDLESLSPSAHADAAQATEARLSR